MNIKKPICLLKVFEEMRERKTTQKTHPVAPWQCFGAHQEQNTFLASENIDLGSHPAHSPDKAPCDFFIFTVIKDLIRGLTFTGTEEAVIAFNQLERTYPYTNGPNVSKNGINEGKGSRNITLKSNKHLLYK